MTWSSRLTVVAGTQGDLGRLDRTLWLLAERHKLRRVLPVGEAVDDAQALLDERSRRFPEERAWTDPDFADFVLHAVLHGVAETPVPEEEVSRTRRLRALLSEIDDGAEVPSRVSLGDHAIAFVRSGSPPPPDVALWVTAAPGPPALLRTPGEPPCLRPGRLGEGRAAGEPPACAILSAEPSGLVVTFVEAAGGEVLSTERV